MNINVCSLTLMRVMLLSSFVASYEILMILPLGPISDKTIFTSLASHLGMKGHNVSIVSMYGHYGNKSLLPYTEIEVANALVLIKNIASDLNFPLLLQKRATVEILKKTVKNQPEHCKIFLKDSAIQKFWTSNPDVILLPSLMNECGLIIVQRFKVPFIYVTTLGLAPISEADLIENSQHPAYALNHYFPYNARITYWELVSYTIIRLLAPSLRRWFILERMDSVARSFLSEPNVSLENVEQNVSLILVNTHHSFGLISPIQPNVVEVGGLHCRRSETISDSKLVKFMDKSKTNSVIIFSLGSLIESARMPDTFNKLLLGAFTKLSFKVIWKWEGTPLKNLPSNILMMDWIPQQDLLGHPSIGGFFTQGGLLSIQESVYHGVPMVILPFMFDQNFNAEHAEAKGYAIVLKTETLTEEVVVSALNRIMKDISYRANVNTLSRLMKDQVTRPVDRATYYIEYVIRHRGAKHLRSGAESLNFLQLAFTDITVTSVSLVISVIFLFCLLFYILKLLLTLLKAVYRRVVLLFSQR